MPSKSYKAAESALSGIRVLDLSDRFGYYIGKLFGDMGADVILVEKPGGCSLRGELPVLDGCYSSNTSIPFNCLNTSKRSIVLDLCEPTDRNVFNALIAQTDLVIEDFAPGVARELGLDYESLAARRPSVVVTSVTPFGQSGPYSNFAADDLSLLAMGGFLTMMGYPGEAPTQTYGNQAVAMGCSLGAVGAMIAVIAAQNDGIGQHVDVSIQQCVTQALENALQTYDLQGIVRTRFAGIQRHAGTGVFECSDGYIYLFAGGIGASRFWKNLVKWLRDENVVGSEILTTEPWQNIAYLDTAEAKDIFNSIFPSFAILRSKEQLYREGQARRVPVSPVNNPGEVVRNQQLQYRNFFVRVPHAGIGRDLIMPGSPFSASLSPGRISRPAPELSQHRDEILSSLGKMKAAVKSSSSRARAV
jgi:benzylsuccinate CoA-transferase BbsE subunit